MCDNKNNGGFERLPNCCKAEPIQMGFVVCTYWTNEPTVGVRAIGSTGPEWLRKDGTWSPYWLSPFKTVADAWAAVSLASAAKAVRCGGKPDGRDAKIAELEKELQQSKLDRAAWEEAARTMQRASSSASSANTALQVELKESNARNSELQRRLNNEMAEVTDLRRARDKAILSRDAARADAATNARLGAEHSVRAGKLELELANLKNTPDLRLDFEVRRHFETRRNLNLLKDEMATLRTSLTAAHRDNEQLATTLSDVRDQRNSLSNRVAAVQAAVDPSVNVPAPGTPGPLPGIMGRGSIRPVNLSSWSF